MKKGAQNQGSSDDIVPRNLTEMAFIGNTQSHINDQISHHKENIKKAAKNFEERRVIRRNKTVKNLQTNSTQLTNSSLGADKKLWGMASGSPITRKSTYQKSSINLLNVVAQIKSESGEMKKSNGFNRGKSQDQPKEGPLGIMKVLSLAKGKEGLNEGQMEEAVAGLYESQRQKAIEETRESERASRRASQAKDGNKRDLDLLEELSVASDDIRLQARGPMTKLEKGMRLFYRVLKIPSDRRSQKDLGLVSQHLKEVEFFRERKMRDSEIDQIAGSMTLKRYHKGECIMQYGDIGETFYFILKGEVKIEVPDSAQEDKYKKHLSKSRFYEEKYDEAHIQIYRLKKHQKDLEEKKNAQDELKKVTVFAVKDARTSKFLDADLPGYFEQAIRNKEAITEKIKEKAEKMKALLIDVGSLGQGKYFGQLALVYDKQRPNQVVRRAATITATEDCMFAIMTKEAYQSCLFKIEERRNDAFIAFLREVPCFRAMSLKALKNLKLFLEPAKYSMNQVVCYEGMETEFVFIIQDGQFEVTRTFDEDNTYVRGKKMKSHLGSQHERASSNVQNKALSGSKFNPNDDFIIKQMTGQTPNSLNTRQIYNAQAFFRNKMPLPKTEQKAKGPYQSDTALQGVSRHKASGLKRKLQSNLGVKVARFGPKGMADSQGGRKTPAKSTVSKKPDPVLNHLQEYNQKARIKVGILGRGQIFGDDDVILNRKVTNTFRCVQNESTCLVIRREAFLRVFEKHNFKEAWRLMYQSAARKEKQHYERTLNFVSINREAHHIKTASDLQQKTGNSRVSDMSAYGDNVDVRKAIINSVQQSPSRFGIAQGNSLGLQPSKSQGTIQPQNQNSGWFSSKFQQTDARGSSNTSEERDLNTQEQPIVKMDFFNDAHANFASMNGSNRNFRPQTALNDSINKVGNSYGIFSVNLSSGTNSPPQKSQSPKKGPIVSIVQSPERTAQSFTTLINFQTNNSNSARQTVYGASKLTVKAKNKLPQKLQPTMFDQSEATSVNYHKQVHHTSTESISNQPQMKVQQCRTPQVEPEDQSGLKISLKTQLDQSKKSEFDPHSEAHIVSEINICDDTLPTQIHAPLNQSQSRFPMKIGRTTNNSMSINFFQSNCGYLPEHKEQIRINQHENLKGTKNLFSEGIHQSKSPYYNPLLRKHVMHQQGVYTPERARGIAIQERLSNKKMASLLQQRSQAQIIKKEHIIRSSSAISLNSEGKSINSLLYSSKVRKVTAQFSKPSELGSEEARKVKEASKTKNRIMITKKEYEMLVNQTRFV